MRKPLQPHHDITHEELVRYMAEQDAALRVTPEEVAATRLAVAKYTISADGLTARLRVRTRWDNEREIYVLIDAADLERVNDRRWWVCWRDKKLRVFTNGDGLRTTALSRFVLEVTDPRTHVRYLSGNPLDNRRQNLKACPPAGGTPALAPVQ